MLEQISTLLLATGVFVVTHLVIPREPLRGLLVSRLGLNLYQGVYSVISILALVWMVVVYEETTRAILWEVTLFSYLPAVVMPVAFVFLISGYTSPNPTALRQERLLASEDPARGIHRVTRHPAMWGITLWSMVHLLAKGDLASSVFFGGIAITAGLGMVMIDMKFANLHGKNWERFKEATSILPFGAIATGKNKMPWGEVGLARIAGGLLVYMIFLYFHERFFGIPGL